MFSEIYETYKQDTRIIYYYEITEQIVSFSKNVNVKDDTFTIYISGIDTRGKVSTVSRSDVNMLVTINPKKKDILLTSIPRDAYVNLVNKGKKDKLTHLCLADINNSIMLLETF